MIAIWQILRSLWVLRGWRLFWGILLLFWQILIVCPCGYLSSGIFYLLAVGIHVRTLLARATYPEQAYISDTLDEAMAVAGDNDDADEEFA
jgi:hypothetical protein